MISTLLVLSIGNLFYHISCNYNFYFALLLNFNREYKIKNKSLSLDKTRRLDDGETG